MRLLERAGTIGIALVLAAFPALLLHGWRVPRRERVHRRVQPLVTTAVFLGYEAVLLRAEQRLATGMSEADVSGFLAALSAAAGPVEISFRWRPQLRDPTDELMLEAAVNGRAAVIVTHNLTDFSPVAPRFSVRVLTPSLLLHELPKR